MPTTAQTGSIRAPASRASRMSWAKLRRSAMRIMRPSPCCRSPRLLLTAPSGLRFPPAPGLCAAAPSRALLCVFGLGAWPGDWLVRPVVPPAPWWHWRTTVPAQRGRSLVRDTKRSWRLHTELPWRSQPEISPAQSMPALGRAWTERHLSSVVLFLIQLQLVWIPYPVLRSQAATIELMPGL